MRSTGATERAFFFVHSVRRIAPVAETVPCRYRPMDLKMRIARICAAPVRALVSDARRHRAPPPEGAIHRLPPPNATRLADILCTAAQPGECERRAEVWRMADAALALHLHCDRDTRMVLYGDSLLWRTFRVIAEGQDAVASERLFGVVAGAIVTGGHDSGALWSAIQGNVPRAPVPHRDACGVRAWAQSVDSQYRARRMNFVQ